MTSTDTPTPIRPCDLGARTRTIAGLRALADFLEANPDVPTREFGWDFTFFPHADTEAGERAEVDRIAALLGETVDDQTTNGGHYTASRSFGPITYSAVHIPANRAAAHAALMSYAPAFERVTA